MNILKWARVQWDRVAAWVVIAAGALAIVLGFVGVSNEGLTTQQVPYVVSGGIGGLFLLGVGAMLWLSADLRDEWRKLDAIERNTRPVVEEMTDPDDPFQPAADADADDPGEVKASDNGIEASATRRRRKPISTP